jgi:hypothetical protein
MCTPATALRRRYLWLFRYDPRDVNEGVTMRASRRQFALWSRSAGAATALAAVAVLAGCGGSGSHPAAAGSGGGSPAAGGTAAPAGSGGGGGGNGKGTCTKVTKADVQRLLVAHVISETTSSTPDLVSADGKAQQCTFATTASSQAITVIVVGGKDADGYYTAAVTTNAKPTALPGVGSKAVRDSSDSSSNITAEDNGVTCQIAISSADQLPGVAKLEQAAGFTSDIGDANYEQVANALGTLCNVVYGSGNTTPDFSKLTAAAASATTTEDETGGLNVPPPPTP